MGGGGGGGVGGGFGAGFFFLCLFTTIISFLGLFVFLKGGGL